MFNRITSLGVALGRQLTLQNLQGELATLTSEIASGKKADPTKNLGVGVSVLYKLYTDVQQGDAIRSVSTMAGQRLETMQTALSSTNKLLGSMAATGLQAVTISDVNSETVVANKARDTMASLATLLNTQTDGEAVFAGTDSGKPPMRTSDIGLLAVRGSLDAAVTANANAPLDELAVAGLLSDLDDMFNGPAPTQYSTLFYTSTSTTGGTPSQIRIGAGETLSYDVRGDHQGFKDAFQALSLMSLLDAKDAVTGASLLDEDAKAMVLDTANGLLGKAQSTLTTVAGILGVKQQRLDAVSDIQEKAVSAATAQINTLEGVDYYTASDRISSLEIQLKATYSITAKLSDLSLVNYLR